MRPGIEPSNNNEELAGIAPVKKRGRLKYILGAAAALGAAALLLNQCSEEKPPAPEVAQPEEEKEGSYLYRYKLTSNVVLRDASAEAQIQEGSCVTTEQNDDGSTPAFRNNEQDILVNAHDENGKSVIGLVSRQDIRNAGRQGGCYAEFIEAPAADTPVATTGPVAQWRTNSADLYNAPDAASPVVASIYSACVESTGKTSGAFMEATVDNGTVKRTFWTPIERYSKTQVPSCQAKM